MLCHVTYSKMLPLFRMLLILMLRRSEKRVKSWLLVIPSHIIAVSELCVDVVAVVVVAAAAADVTPVLKMHR